MPATHSSIFPVARGCKSTFVLVVFAPRIPLFRPHSKRSTAIHARSFASRCQLLTRSWLFDANVFTKLARCVREACTRRAATWRRPVSSTREAKLSHLRNINANATQRRAEVSASVMNSDTSGRC